MKKLFLTSLLATAFSAQAATCNIVVPVTPGGATDMYARTLQKATPDIQIEYKPGAYATTAISFLSKHPDYALLTIPTMYSQKNPNIDQASEVELIKFITSSPQVFVVNNPNMTFEKLLTSKVFIGIAFFGSPGHLIAEQIKEKNPQAEIVPFGTDLKAMPSLKNHEIDLLILNGALATAWSRDFGFQKILTVPMKGLTKDGVTLNNIASQGIFVSKNASAEQKENVEACINESISKPEWINYLKDNNIQPINVTGNELEKSLTELKKLQQRYGL